MLLGVGARFQIVLQRTMSNKITALGAAKPKAQMGLGAFLVKGVKMSENKILAASAPTRARFDKTSRACVEASPCGSLSSPARPRAGSG